MTMSSSTMLYVFLIGLCVASVQGLTLRLKGEKTISDGGEVNITDLLVGGCRGYNSLECLSDVPYGRIIEKAYWKYTDPITLKYYKVDDIHCKVCPKCESPNIGWRSARGIYRKEKSYFNVLRLGRDCKKAAVGLFTCHIEGDSKSPVSVKIVDNLVSPSPPPSPNTIIVPFVSKTPTPSPSPDPSIPPVFETPIPSPSPAPPTPHDTLVPFPEPTTQPVLPFPSPTVSDDPVDPTTLFPQETPTP